MMTVKEYVEGKVKILHAACRTLQARSRSFRRHCCPGRILRTGKRLGDVRRRNGQRAGDAARGIWGDHVCLTLSTMSCGTPCMTQKKKSLPVRQHGQAQRVMSLAAHHHKNNIKQEVLQVALLRIYDVGQEPPALVSQQQFPVASDAVAIADELAKRKPEQLYRVFDADMNVVYACSARKHQRRQRLWLWQ